jgi:hypothetical protein
VSSFDEELEQYQQRLETIYGRIRQLEYQLSIEKSNYDKLLHNKVTESKFQNFKRLKDGSLSFRCLYCGDRSKAKTHAAKYCKDCSDMTLRQRGY